MREGHLASGHFGVTVYLLNAFSLNMLVNALSFGRTETIKIEPVTVDEVKSLAADLVSAVGHADTAAVLLDTLGAPVACARINVALNSGDSAIIAQFSGPRLPEGATTLPPGAKIVFLKVSVL